MNKYGLYIRLTEEKKEPLRTIDANSLDEAINLFSKMKKINKDVMLDIFEIRQLS